MYFKHLYFVYRRLSEKNINIIIKYAAPPEWNKLPHLPRESPSMDRFNAHL